jgi:outer membrane receptor protein involved in Fe transport
MFKQLARLTTIAVVVPMGALAQQTEQKPADSIHERRMDEIVISASRKQELLMSAPVSVRLADSSFLNHSASASKFDALEHVQGVQMITPSMGFRILNTRGFANTTNVRFAQLVDGMDVASPHIGAPIGNALGPGDLDLQKVEILPGIASALYGMNTVSGLADMMTKDPFQHPGLSIQQKTSVINLHSNSASTSVFSQTDLRWALAVHPRFAFKLNLGLTQGSDWIADDRTDQNPTANQSTGLLGEDNPAKDPINTYGNESSNRKTLTLDGKSYVVARTGYAEKELTDAAVHNIRGDLAIHFKFNEKSTLVFTARAAQLDNIYQRANRFMLRNYLVHQEGLQFHSNAIQARVYWNAENSGDSYNLRSMGENMDKAFKPETKWYSDYSSAFHVAHSGGESVADAHRYARVHADSGRLVPGTAAFQQTLSKLQQINNWDIGAALKVIASFVHAEVQYDLSKSLLTGFRKSTGVDVMVGLDQRTYFIHPDGNYFINPVPGKGGTDIHYGKMGGFLALQKNLFGQKLGINAILRADKNDYFTLRWNPRISLVYQIRSGQSVRVSFQDGYRYPSIFEAYSNINSGGTKRVGGLPVMSNGIFENAWLQTSIAAFQAANLKDQNQGGLTKNQAIDKNKGLLVKNPYTYIRPEHVRSFELGYRGRFMGGRLGLDVDAWFSQYRDFIAQANMNVPKTSIPDSIPYYLADNAKQDKYRMYTNSRTTISTYGLSAGLRYRVTGSVNAYANATYSKLSKASNEDGLEDGFNTPEWIWNAGVSADRIFDRLGGTAGVHGQTAYYWQSFLVNGNVPAYVTFDASLTYPMFQDRLGLKLGASNLFNNYYRSILGGPSVGGQYYLVVRFGLP